MRKITPKMYKNAVEKVRIKRKNKVRADFIEVLRDVIAVEFDWAWEQSTDNGWDKSIDMALKVAGKKVLEMAREDGWEDAFKEFDKAAD